MIIKNQRRASLIVLVLFILAILVNIFGIFTNTYSLIYISTPLIFSFLLAIYVVSVKKDKLSRLFVVHLIFVFLAELLFVFKEKYFLYTLLCSIISQIILIFFIIKFRHIKYKDMLYYFAITFASYYIIYTYVLDVESSVMIVIYGIVNSLLTAFALVNYLKKMYMANYLLWLGVATGVLNNGLISLNIFEMEMNILVLLTNVISHYLICKSFIVRANKLPPKNVLANV